MNKSSWRELFCTMMYKGSVSQLLLDLCTFSILMLQCQAFSSFVNSPTTVNTKLSCLYQSPSTTRLFDNIQQQKQRCLSVPTLGKSYTTDTLLRMSTGNDGDDKNYLDSKNDNENNDSMDLASSEDTTTTEKQSNKDDEEERKKKKFIIPKPIRDTIDVTNLLFSYTIIFIGTALSFGLVLNLCGYAYTFTAQDGLRIDTIEQMRKERQFALEARRLKVETEQTSQEEQQTNTNFINGASETQPPTLLPR